MKCVLYARVSSKEQEKEGFSIPAQQKLLLEYAHRKRFTVVSEFTDVETAKTAGRTQFGLMVAYLKANSDVKAILVEKTDRIYRNFRDYLLLEDLGVELHLVKENEVISKDSRSHAKLIHGIKVVLAKNFIDNLSEEVKKGMREKAEQGEWPGKAPIGYVNNKATHLVTPDDIKAQAVRVAFESYATGKYSLSKMRELLYDHGLRQAGDRKLSKSMVELILKNPFYFGDFAWSGQTYRGVHEAIISRELYETVQSKLRRASSPRGGATEFAFRGLLKCGKCGSAIVGEIKKGKYIYYHCTSARGKCNQPYVREEQLEELLSETLKAISITPAMTADIVEALRDYHAKERNYSKSEILRLNKRLEELRRRLDKAYEDRLDGVIDEAYWRDVSTKWRGEQDSITCQLQKLQSAERGSVDSALKILELAQKAYSLYITRTPHEKRQLLDSVLSNCSLDGLTVSPTYKKPFNYIAEGLDLQIKLPRLDSNQRPAD